MANHSDLLQILNAHGQQFAESFKAKAPPRKRKRAVRGPVPILLGDQNEDDTEEEWKGCESKAGSEDIGMSLAEPCACLGTLIPASSPSAGERPAHVG